MVSSLPRDGVLLTSPCPEVSSGHIIIYFNVYTFVVKINFRKSTIIGICENLVCHIIKEMRMDMRMKMKMKVKMKIKMHMYMNENLVGISIKKSLVVS